MYCDQCGNELKSDDKYCPDCGAAVGLQETGLPLQKKKSRKALWITLISVIAAAAILFAVYMIFFRNIGTVMLLGKAFINLSAETEERYNGTPLAALEILGEILEDGSITADFTYTSSFLGGWISIDIDGQIKLLSDTEARNFALEARIGVYGESIDLDFYMNSERMAVRFRLLGNDFYGLTYDTFRNDIRVLGNQIGLDPQTMDMYADFIDQLNTAMNTEAVSDDIDHIYSEIMQRFIKNLKITSKKERVGSDSGAAHLRVITVTATKKALIDLLSDISSNEEAMKSQFNIHKNIFAQNENITYTDDYDSFVNEFNAFIKEFDQKFKGTIDLAFLIDSDDRLTRIQTDSRIEYGNDIINLWVVLDFGNSVYNEWNFYFSYTDAEDTKPNYINIDWDYKEHGSNKINSVSVSTNTVEPISIISEWDQTGGNFILTVADNNDSYTVSGVLKATDTNVHIKFDEINFADSDNKLNIEITTQTGITINDIDYINIDKWGNLVFEALLGLITAPLFR